MTQELYTLGKDVLLSDTFQLLSKYNHHGNINTLEHSIHVAEKSLDYVNRHKIKCDKQSLVVGCLLHDLFLYDCHKKEYRWKRMHLFTHPKVALKNAELYFSLNPIEKEVIVKHMWPCTLSVPKCKEAWIIVWADKVCAMKEFTHKKREKEMLEKCCIF